MDLIIPGEGTLTFNQEKELRSSFNSIDDDFCKKKKLKPKDYLFQSNKCYQRLKIIKPIWKYLSRDSKVKESHYFYDCIYRCKGSSPSNTEWISTGIESNKYTSDHPFTARLSMRIIMTDWPPFMDTFEDFAEEINFLTQTIGISAKENQDVKVIPDNFGEIRVNELTSVKYDNFIFKSKYTDEIRFGLPFNVPEWFSNGERKRLITSKEKEKKSLNKLKLFEIRQKAQKLGINIKNNMEKNINKSGLIELIINHNDQMLS
jgi:hypothetical protein